jgi:Xaa-Pro dipeptidase
LPAPSLAYRRAAAALPRLRDVLAGSGAGGLVLTSPGSVAWATGGASPAIDRSAALDPAWVAVGPDVVRVVTSSVEAARLRAEGPFGELGWEVAEVPWWEPAAFVKAAADVFGGATDLIGSDGHPAFQVDLSAELIATRMVLSAPDVEAVRLLGQQATAVVESALREWTPGATDLEVAARIAAGVESLGALAPVLLVGGDDRLARFRHPVATGAPLLDAVMAVLVASRGGLHVALTRYAATASWAAAMQGPLATVRRIHARVLEQCRPGVSTGSVLAELDAGYRDEGYPEAWREHYQGGPIGYAQREFEISPAQRGDPWWEFQLADCIAVAWNPSISGGAKDEDTYLIGADGVEQITYTADWPTTTAGAGTSSRPAVLVADR